jgi:DNA primase
MEYSRMDFLEAIEELANRAGLEIPRDASKPATEDNLTELYELMELIVRFYRQQLREHPEAGRAVEYLKNRGLSGELAGKFELGYAPPGWDNLIKQFGQSNAALVRLGKIGMTIQRNDTGNGYYDRFRDRIMFPIRDHRGRAIGFGGRTLGEEKPKYLNSPETPIFHKGRELYGLYQARHATKQIPRLFVVEGYMDVLALVQNGISNVVATLGTASTPDHLNRIFRNTDQIVFCFDGDEAGRNAAWKAMEIALPLLRDGKQAWFMFMPDGYDPDDFVREKGRSAFDDVHHFIPLSEYLVNTLKSRNDLSTREGRSRLVDQAMPYVSALPHGALRQILLRDIAGIARTPLEDIEPLLQKSDKITQKTGNNSSSSGNDRNAVTAIIELLLYQPGLATLIDNPAELEQIPVAGTPFLRQLVDLIHTRPQISCAGIIENWRGTRYEARLRQIAASSGDRTVELTDPERELLDSINMLRNARDKQIRRKLSNSGSVSNLTDAEKELLRKPSGRSKIPSDN